MVCHYINMKIIRVANAMAHLCKFMSGLSSGEDVLIIRHGLAVAKVSHITGKAVAARIRANARELKAGRFTDAELAELARQGRR